MATPAATPASNALDASIAPPASVWAIPGGSGLHAFPAATPVSGPRAVASSPSRGSTVVSLAAPARGVGEASAGWDEMGGGGLLPPPSTGRGASRMGMMGRRKSGIAGAALATPSVNNVGRQDAIGDDVAETGEEANATLPGDGSRSRSHNDGSMGSHLAPRDILIATENAQEAPRGAAEGTALVFATAVKGAPRAFEEDGGHAAAGGMSCGPADASMRTAVRRPHQAVRVPAAGAGGGLDGGSGDGGCGGASFSPMGVGLLLPSVISMPMINEGEEEEGGEEEEEEQQLPEGSPQDHEEVR